MSLKNIHQRGKTSQKVFWDANSYIPWKIIIRKALTSEVSQKMNET